MGQVCYLARSQPSLLESKVVWGFSQVRVKIVNDFVHTGNTADEDIALGYNFLDLVSMKSIV